MSAHGLLSQGPVPAGVIPDARQLRARLRRARRAHREGRLGDFLTDAYMLALLLAMYGWAAVATVADYARPEPQAATAAGARSWFTIATVLIIAGFVWQGLRALGPLFVTPAAQSFALSTPVGRRGLLAPRLVGTVATTAVVGAGAGALAGGFAQVGAVWVAALCGALVGAALAGASVVGQADRTALWPRLLGSVAITVGVCCGAGVLGLRAAGIVTPTPTIGLGALAAAFVVVVSGALSRAVRAVGNVDRAALSSGAEVASAVAGAATMLDPSMLSEVLAARRWRRIGRVTSRRLRRAPRWGVLLQADLVRLTRRPTSLLVFGMLLLVPYAVSLVAPAFVDAVRIIVAYLAVDRLAGGLRAVCRSTSLRRALGGSNSELRLAHLVVPSVALAVFWAATYPVVEVRSARLTVLLVIGVLAAVYRAAGRKPVSYSGFTVDTPMGLLPLDLLRQLFRGPDVLAIVLLVSMIAEWLGRSRSG